MPNKAFDLLNRIHVLPLALKVTLGLHSATHGELEVACWLSLTSL